MQIYQFLQDNLMMMITLIKLKKLEIFMMNHIKYKKRKKMKKNY